MDGLYSRHINLYILQVTSVYVSIFMLNSTCFALVYRRLHKPTPLMLLSRDLILTWNLSSGGPPKQICLTTANQCGGHLDKPRPHTFRVF